MTNSSDLPPDSSATDKTLQSKPAAPAARRCRRWIWGVFCLLVVLVLAGGFVLYQKNQQLVKQLDQLQQHSERAMLETELKSQQANEIAHRLEIQLAQLTNQFAETQHRQQAFDNFYQEFTRDRESWTLIEIGRVLAATNEQLRLTSNVPLALLSLKRAQARLAVFDSVRARAARQAITQDIKALQAAPAVDFVRWVNLLDEAIAQVDELPLLGEAAPSFPAAASAVASEQSHWRANWEQFKQAFVKQLASFVQVRPIEHADVMRVAPTEGYFLRENLKLRLLSARLSLLSHNAATLKTDLKISKQTLTRYFDIDARRTQTLRALMEQLESAPQALELPDLSASLRALHQE